MEFPTVSITQISRKNKFFEVNFQLPRIFFTQPTPSSPTTPHPQSVSPSPLSTLPSVQPPPTSYIHTHLTRTLTSKSPSPDHLHAPTNQPIPVTPHYPDPGLACYPQLNCLAMNKTPHYLDCHYQC